MLLSVGLCMRAPAGFSQFLGLSIGSDAMAALVSATTGLRIAPAFDNPYLSTSRERCAFFTCCSECCAALHKAQIVSACSHLALLSRSRRLLEPALEPHGVGGAPCRNL